MDNISKIQSAISESDLDAILLTDAKNRRYATGFRSSAGAALVTRTEAYFITDSRYIEAAHEKIKNAKVLQSTKETNERAWLVELIGDCNIRRLGFEDERTTFAEYNRFSEVFRTELCPAQDILKRLRASKSAEELDMIKSAQRISEAAFDGMLGILKPGLAEREVAAYLSYQMSMLGAEGNSFDPIVVAGKKSSLPHGEPGDNIIKNGDFVVIDFGCVFEGYCSDMTRTVAVGSVSDEMRSVYDTVLKAQMAGIAASKPGVQGFLPDKAARDIIISAGYGEFFGHSFGHGLGLDIHEAPSPSAAERAILPEGAVISAEPGIYLPGRFGVRIEDLLYLTGDGCINITKTPKELLIV